MWGKRGYYLDNNFKKHELSLENEFSHEGFNIMAKASEIVLPVGTKSLCYKGNDLHKLTINNEMEFLEVIAPNLKQVRIPLDVKQVVLHPNTLVENLHEFEGLKHTEVIFDSGDE